jgi:hypothetical protein
MDNYEAVAYACLALKSLRERNKEVNTSTLDGAMNTFMDRFSEEEIRIKFDKEIKQSTEVF